MPLDGTSMAGLDLSLGIMDNDLSSCRVGFPAGGGRQR